MYIQRKPTHPGTVFLEDFLKPMNITVTQAAKDLGISRKALSEIVNGHTRLTAMIAKKIAVYTRTSFTSWYQMQVNIDYWEAEQITINDVLPYNGNKESL